jgi:hypothetical protein
MVCVACGAQAVLNEEVGVLADAMHEATLGGGGLLRARTMPTGEPYDAHEPMRRTHTAAPPAVGPAERLADGGLAAGIGALAGRLQRPRGEGVQSAPPPVAEAHNAATRRERLMEAQKRLDYEEALASARSVERQRGGWGGGA